MAGETGAKSLCRMIGGDPVLPATPIWMEALPIWMEALPMPPRKREGNTNLDLACGGIRSRGLMDKEGPTPNRIMHSAGELMRDHINGLPGQRPLARFVPISHPGNNPSDTKTKNQKPKTINS